ncbi:MAG: PTS sugar transporter subunit IIB [Erysipelotrichaceae bacterium]
MILKLRIDDRLLHGQVAYSWKSALSYNAIVIASNEAAKDEMRKTTIKLCCPDGVKLATRSIDDAAILLKNPKLQEMKVFVICPNPKSAYELLKQIGEKPVINLGGMQMENGKKLFSKAVYVSEEDVTYLDKIQSDNYKIEVQEVPSTSVHEYQSLRNKVSFDK